jgi:hypothetical protein
MYMEQGKGELGMRVLMNILVLGLLAGCGEPIKGVGDDAKTAKAQAHDAVSAAEDAAKRVEELSRPVPADPAKDPQQN